MSRKNIIKGITGGKKMKKSALFFIFVLVLSIFSASVTALSWYDQEYQFVESVNGQITNKLGKTITIENSESATFSTGPIYSMEDYLNIDIGLYKNGEMIYKIVEKNYNTDTIVADLFTITSDMYGNEVGQYIVFMIVDDDFTDFSTQSPDQQLTFTVTEETPVINTDPGAEFTYDPVNPVVDELVSFTSLSLDADGDSLTHSWDFGDNSVSTLMSPTHSYSAAGSYQVTLTVDDGNGGQDSVMHVVFVTEDVDPLNHAPVANFDYSPQPVFVGVETTFDASLSADQDFDVLSYAWVIDGNDNGLVGVETTYTFDAEGTYNVQLTVTDEHGDQDTIIKAVQVIDNQPQNEQPVANFDFEQPVYATIPATFTSTSTDDGLLNDLSFTWFVNGQEQLVEEESVDMTFNAPGNYEVTLIVNDGELSDDVTKPVQVFPIGNDCPTDLDFTYQPLNPEAGDLVTFTGTAQDPQGNPLDYAWDFNYNGIFNTDNTGEEVSIEYAFPGVYTVAMSVTDSDGLCDVLYTEEVVVSGGELDFVSLECFDFVVQGGEQVCNSLVYNNLGTPEFGVSIALYRETGENDELLGTCNTFLAGKCQVKFTEDNLGEQTVYAAAQKDGFGSGVYLSNEFTYDVFVEAYDIVGLETFGSLTDMENDVSKETFFRGEPLFVKFQVEDINTGAIVQDPNVVTSASLVSLAGGMAWLEELNAPLGWNYYMLNPIPTNHEFYGESQAFAFAFEFDLQQGGQEYVDLLILNNPPEIVGLPDSIQVPNVDSYNYNLEPFESDLEDNEDQGDDGMMWQVSDVSGALFTADIVGKELVIQPIAGQNGFEEVTLSLFDKDSYNGLELTDANPSQQTITVYVGDQTELSANIVANTPTEGLAPLTVEFGVEVTGGVGPYSYEWDFNDGSPIVTNENPVHTFNEPGDYVVILTVTDSADTEVITTMFVKATSEIMSVDILVNGQDVGDSFGGGVPFELTFTADAIGGFGELDYHWIVVDTGTVPQEVIFPTTPEEELEASQMTFSYLFSDIGNYIVYSIVTDDFGNSAVDTLILTTEEDEFVSMLLKASPQHGHAPLEVDFTLEILTGNAPYAVDINFGDGEKETVYTNSQKYEFTHIFQEEGDYDVVVRATDGDGDMVEAVVTINVRDEKTKTTPRKVVGWTNLRLLGGEFYVPGDYIELMVNFKNKANWDLENVKVAVTVPELGIRKTAGPFDVSDGQEITKILYLEVPYYAQQGEYDIRVTINADGDEKIHRIKHRRFIVE
ncbi:PKD domain-containing protein [Candidatus Woesearchaeota archaeon]|nr:PKD domain-containing protein [Candidatus Woesearchaeota archaeon]